MFTILAMGNVKGKTMVSRTKNQLEHMYYFTSLMQQIEWDIHNELLDERRVPSEWHEIGRAKGTPHKVRLTLRVDEDVIKFYRKFGRGYQGRMNDVLSAWMHGRLAGLLKGPDARDVAEEVLEVRPRLGTSEAEVRGMVRDGKGRWRDKGTGALMGFDE